MKNMGGGSNISLYLENPYGNQGFDGSFSGEKGFQGFWDDIQDFFSEGQGTKKQDKKIKKGKDINVIYF